MGKKWDWVADKATRGAVFVAENAPGVKNKWKARKEARLAHEAKAEEERLTGNSPPAPKGATTAHFPDAFNKAVTEVIAIIVSSKSRHASVIEAPHILASVVTSPEFIRDSVENTVGSDTDPRTGKTTYVTTKTPLEDDAKYEYGMRDIRAGLARKLSGPIGSVEFSNEERDILVSALCSNSQHFELLMRVVESTAQKEAKGNEGLFISSFLHHATSNYTVTGHKPETPPARTFCSTALANQYVANRSSAAVEATVQEFALAAYTVLTTETGSVVPGEIATPGLYVKVGDATVDGKFSGAAKALGEFRTESEKILGAIDTRVAALSNAKRTDGSSDQQEGARLVSDYQGLSGEVAILRNQVRGVESEIANAETALGAAVLTSIDAQVKEIESAQSEVLKEVDKVTEAREKVQSTALMYEAALRSGAKNTSNLEEAVDRSKEELATAEKVLLGAQRALEEKSSELEKSDQAVSDYIGLKMNVIVVQYSYDKAKAQFDDVSHRLDTLSPSVPGSDGLVSLAKKQLGLRQKLNAAMATVTEHYGITETQLPTQFRQALLAKKDVKETKDGSVADPAGRHFFENVPSALANVENTTITALTNRVDKLLGQFEALRTYREGKAAIDAKNAEKTSVVAALGVARGKDQSIDANAKQVVDLEAKEGEIDLAIKTLESTLQSSGLKSDFDAFSTEVASVRIAVGAASLPKDTTAPIVELLDALGDSKTTKESLDSKASRKYKTVKEVHAYPMRRAATVAVDSIAKRATASRRTGVIAPGQYIAMASVWSVVAPGKDIGVEGKGKLEILGEKIDRTFFSTYNARHAAAYLYEKLGFKRTLSLLTAEAGQWNVAVDEKGTPLTDASKASRGWAYQYLVQSKWGKKHSTAAKVLYYGLYPITGINFEPASKRFFSGMKRVTFYTVLLASLAVWEAETTRVQPTAPAAAGHYNDVANYAKPKGGEGLGSLFSHFVYSPNDRANGGYRIVPLNLSFPYGDAIGGTFTEGVPGAFSEGFTRRFPFWHPIDATAALTRPYTNALERNGSPFTWLNPVTAATQVRGWDGSQMRNGNIVSVYDDSPHVPERLGTRELSFFGYNYRVLDTNNQAWLRSNPEVARFFQERASLRRVVDGSVHVLEPSPGTVHSQLPSAAGALGESNVCATRPGVAGLHCNLLVMQLNPIVDGLRLNAYRSDEFVARIQADITRDRPRDVRTYLEAHKLEYATSGFLVPIRQWNTMHRFGLTDQAGVAFIQRNGVTAIALMDGLVNRAASDRYLPHGNVVGHFSNVEGRFGRVVGSTSRFTAEENHTNEFVTAWMAECGPSTEAIAPETLRAAFDRAVAAAPYLIDVSTEHAEAVLQRNVAALGLHDPSAIDTYRTVPQIQALLDQFIPADSAYVIKTGKTDELVVAIAMHIQSGGRADDFNPFSNPQGSSVAEVLAQGENGLFAPRRTEITGTNGPVTVSSNHDFESTIKDAFGVETPGAAQRPSGVILDDGVIQTAITNHGNMGTQRGGAPRLDAEVQARLVSELSRAGTDQQQVRAALVRFVSWRVDTLAGEVAAGVPSDLTGAARSNAERRITLLRSKLTEAGITNVRMDNGRVVYDFNSTTNWNNVQGFIIQQCFGGTPPVVRVH